MSSTYSRKLVNSSADSITSSISTFRYFFHLSSTLEGTVGSSSLREPKLYYVDAKLRMVMVKLNLRDTVA